MTDQTITDVLYLIDAWERGAYAEEYPNEIEALRQALAQPEQEPVMEVQYFGDSPVYILLRPISDGTKLYTAPPSRPDLSQEMVDALQQWANGEKFGDQEELDNARLSRNVILAKIKEKNNG